MSLESCESGFHGLRKDLVRALESARSRLAVAIAAESKATPLARWRYYMETEHLMRRCLKELRSNQVPPGHTASWSEVLERLDRIGTRQDTIVPLDGIRRFCTHLRDVIERLEDGR